MVNNFLKNKQKLESVGLKLLIEENQYKGTNVKYKIGCPNKHVWEARLNDLLDKKMYRESKGCPQCAEDIYIKESYDIAMKKKPKDHIIIDSYLKPIIHKRNKHVRVYSLKCEFGHIYEKRNADMENGCPDCSATTYVGEERVRMIFEKEFNCLFPTLRPDWLVYPLTNKTLELDGYCEKLKIAFEYQGRQHGSNDTQFGGDYFNQKERDEYKVKKCAEYGIKLYIINQPRSYDKNKFFESVKIDCENQGLILKINNDDIDFTKINDNNTAIKNYNAFYDFAKSKDYELISPSFSTMEDVLSFKCKEGHFFDMKGSMFKSILNTKKYRDIPCLECHNHINPDKKRDIITIETCISFAKNNGLECLSTEYINVNEKMNWKCSQGHTFTKTYRQFLRSKTKNYCPICTN